MTQTVTDEALKTATRVSVTLYSTSGARFTTEIRCDESNYYNYCISEVNGNKFIDIFSFNRETGTLERTANTGLEFQSVSVDYL